MPRARIFHGHDWVYASEIKKTFGEPKPGDVISLKDFKDRPLGSAIYNPESQIVARRISRRKQILDHDFFVRRITQAKNLRERLPLDPRLCRVVWSESDGLPGVIVDRYGDQLVLQTLTLAMDQRKDLIIAALAEIFQPQTIILRNDAPIRKAEGLSPEVSVVYGEDQGTVPIIHEGVTYHINLLTGQKTGLYLDQLDAYQQVARFAKDLRVLDCFSNQGGFGLACAQAGAAHVTCVDVSADAVEAVKKNATASNLEVDAVEANVFDYLKECGETWDLIILDPPSFTKSKKSINDAMRGYKEIHLRALKLLNFDGYLASFSCSHHISRAVFMDSIRSGAVDAHKTLRLVESYSQRVDHPTLINLPETEYLKGALLQLMPGR